MLQDRDTSYLLIVYRYAYLLRYYSLLLGNVALDKMETNDFPWCTTMFLLLFVCFDYKLLAHHKVL